MNMFASVKNLPEFIKSTSAIRDHTNWTKEDFFDAWKTNSVFSEPTAARVIADKVAKISAASIIDNEPALKSNDVWNAFSRHPDAFRRPFEKMEAQVRSVTSAAGLDPNGKTILKDVDVWKMYMANPRLLQSGGVKIGARLQRIYKHFMDQQGHELAAKKMRTVVHSGSASIDKQEGVFASWLSAGCKLRTGQGHTPAADNINTPREDSAQDRMKQLVDALGDTATGKPVLTTEDALAIFSRFPAEITFGDVEMQIERFKTLQDGCANRLFTRKPRETAQTTFRRLWRDNLKTILLATDETFSYWIEDQKAAKPDPAAPTTAFLRSAAPQFMNPAEPPPDFVPWHRIGQRVDFAGQKIQATPLQHTILKRFEDYGAHTLDSLADRLKGQTTPNGKPVTSGDIMESFQQIRGTVVQRTGTDFFKGTFRAGRMVTPLGRP